MFTNNPSLTHVDNTEMLARNLKHNTHSASDANPRFEAVRVRRRARGPRAVDARQRNLRLLRGAVRGNAGRRLASALVVHLQLRDAMVSVEVLEPLIHLILWQGKRHIANEEAARILLAPKVIHGQLAPRRQLNLARRAEEAHGDDWRRRA